MNQNDSHEPPTPWTQTQEQGKEEPAGLPDDFTQRVARRVESQTSFVDVIVLVLSSFSTTILTFLRIDKRVSRTHRKEH